MENKEIEQTKTIAPLFDPSKPNVTKMLDPHSGLLYWDEQPEVFYKQYRKLTSQFWVPQEISLQTDVTDWNNHMTKLQKEFFKRAVSQLVLLDSIATVIDGKMADFVKSPAVKTLMYYISSQESIHNESYTYISTSFMTKEEANEVFEKPKKDPLVIKATQPILDAFDEFVRNPNPDTFAFALIAMSSLEGIRFTNGFTPFYYLNRSNLMQGSGSVINLINRDESQHSYTQTAIVRILLTEYPEIDEKKLTEKTYKLFKEVVDGEKALVESMYEGFKDIDLVEVNMYIEWRANMLLANLGLDKIFATKRNPMKWISVYDPENKNNQKTDFFEKRETNYSKTDVKKNRWDDL